MFFEDRMVKRVTVMTIRCALKHTNVMAVMSLHVTIVSAPLSMEGSGCLFSRGLLAIQST